MESRCAARATPAVALRGDRYHGYDPPSFSSTLLDAIYRSFDDSGHDHRPSSLFRSQPQSCRGEEEEVLFREIMFKKQSSAKNGGDSTVAAVMMKSSSASLDRRSRVGDADGRRSRDPVVDRWMEKTTPIDEDLIVRQRSSAMASQRRRSLGSVKVNLLSTSSSDSSPGGGFSSSDTDSFYGRSKKKSLKPIRTSVSDHRSETFGPRTQFETSLSDELLYRKNRQADQRPPKSDSACKTAKSRAMKFYGDLKRMKQPISPGGKLSNFLNSLFSASGGSKKQRTSSSPSSAPPAGDRYDAGRWDRESKSNYTTNSTPTCSTASSYSRSCLSKTPSSAGRNGGGVAGVKRSVRFCPVSVIIDEDLRPCGHKSLRGTETTAKPSCNAPAMAVIDEELKLRMLEKNRRIEEMARDLLRNYHQRKEVLAARKDQINEADEEMEIISDQNDDDVKSCCSSDLFELEIGVDRYCEELPVYETTRVDTNRAIASGLIV